MKMRGKTKRLRPAPASGATARPWDHDFRVAGLPQGSAESCVEACPSPRLPHHGRERREANTSPECPSAPERKQAPSLVRGLGKRAVQVALVAAGGPVGKAPSGRNEAVAPGGVRSACAASGPGLAGEKIPKLRCRPLPGTAEVSRGRKLEAGRNRVGRSTPQSRGAGPKPPIAHGRTDDGVAAGVRKRSQPSNSDCRDGSTHHAQTGSPLPPGGRMSDRNASTSARGHAEHRKSRAGRPTPTRPTTNEAFLIRAFISGIRWPVTSTQNYIRPFLGLYVLTHRGIVTYSNDRWLLHSAPEGRISPPFSFDMGRGQ